MSYSYAVGFFTGSATAAALALTTYKGFTLALQNDERQTKVAWYSAAAAGSSARIIAHVASATTTTDFGYGVSDGASTVGSIVSYIAGMKMQENHSSKLPDYKQTVNTHKYTVETVKRSIVPYGIPSIIVDMMIPREYQLLRGALPIFAGAFAAKDALSAVKNTSK